MKRDQLEKRLTGIGKRIEKSEVIKNSVELTRKRGEYKTQMHSCHTSVEARFSGNDYLGKRVDIEYKDGLTMFGGGYIRVFYDGKVVLDANRYNENKTGLAVKAGEFYIGEFHPGNWQKQIEHILVAGLLETKKKVEIPQARPEDIQEVDRRFSKWK